MLSVVSHQGNENQNYKEVLLHPYWYGDNFKKGK